MFRRSKTRMTSLDDFMLLSPSPEEDGEEHFSRSTLLHIHTDSETVTGDSRPQPGEDSEDGLEHFFDITPHTESEHESVAGDSCPQPKEDSEEGSEHSSPPTDSDVTGDFRSQDEDAAESEGGWIAASSPSPPLKRNVNLKPFQLRLSKIPNPTRSLPQAVKDPPCPESVLKTLDVYSSTETGEDTSGDEIGERPRRNVSQSEEEVVMAGLLGHTKSPRLEVVNLGPPKGRGVVAKEPIKKGQYVCEYRTYKVYPVGSEEAQSLAQEYELNGEGSYVIQTAYVVPGAGHRLCFDATRRFKDVGRLINHAASGYNLKVSKPTYVRKKWRVGMVAIRDIPMDAELTYDYGVRTDGWMRVKGNSATAEVVEVEAEEDNRACEEDSVPQEDEVQILAVSKTSKLPIFKRNYFWCPVVDCTSGPVQKMTQHLQKKHKMTSVMAAKHAKKKRRAPVEAVRLKIPNPQTRSSKMKNLALTHSTACNTPTLHIAQSPLFTDNKPALAYGKTAQPLTAAPTSTLAVTATPASMKQASTSSATPTSHKAAHSVSVPLCTPSTSGLSGSLHMGGRFLDEFYGHLKTRAGGSRGDPAAKQIVRYVGKYLHHLNPLEVEESALLDPSRVQEYLQTVEASGIGSCGLLHRILAHKAAVHFMRMTMVDDGELRRAERILWHLSQVDKTYKVEKQKNARDILLHQALEGGADCMHAVQAFKEDPRVLHTFKKEASMILQGHLSRARYNTCLGLLAARLMFLNAQRPSAITGMTKDELAEGLQRRKLGQTDRAMVVVKNHKTARKEAAILVADGPSVQMALLWMKILSTLQLPDCTLAFPELDGGTVRHLERKIENASKLIGRTMPTSTSVRKYLEIRNKRLCGPIREGVSRALSHSLGTAQQYYQAPTVSDAYRAYSVMQDIIGGVRGCSPTKEDDAEEDESGRGEERLSPQESGDRPSTEASGLGEDRASQKGRESLERVQQVKKWSETALVQPEDRAKKGKDVPSWKREILKKGEVRTELGGEGRQGEARQPGERVREEKGKGRAKPGAQWKGQEEDDVEVCEWVPSPKKKRKFSPEQTALIEKYFSRHIAERNFPLSIECRDFLNLYKAHFQDRTAKDVYDKCRNLAGR